MTCWALTYCSNSLCSSKKAFHVILDTTALRVSAADMVMRPGSQSAFPEVLRWVEVRALCRLVNLFHTKQRKLCLY